MLTPALAPDVIETRKATIHDLVAIKAIADGNKRALGFLTRATLAESIQHGGVMVIAVNGAVVGFQHYYHRKRDLQTTLYHKAILHPWRGRGLGRKLVDAVVSEARVLGREKLILKCPVDLPSNGFHEKYGFRLIRTESGKRRALNVWELQV